MLPDWQGRTAVCIASGPSLTVSDCELVRASGHPVVVTNTTFRSCPWADALFGFDAPWWRLYIEEVRRVFLGRLFSKSPLVRRLGVEWAVAEQQFIAFGLSGACAVSLAIGAGASRVVLLGYDAQLTDGKSHHHGDHPEGLNNCKSIGTWPAQFGRLARYAKLKGVQVLNASRVTALESFERMPLERCL